MTRDETEVVSALRQGLCERIGQGRFALWFGVGVRLAFSGRTLTVSTADQFLLDRLRKQFLRDLTAAAEQACGLPTEIRLEVDASLKPVASSTADSGGSASSTAKASEAAERDVRPPAVSSPRRRFATLPAFVVGDGNRLAYTAAISVVQRPGVVSPVLVYGPTGCGKTHLLEGIWSDVRRRCRAGRALLLSAEQFTTSFLEALQGSGLPNFRRKCRDVDVLLIDDVQFFEGKRATVVELLHTIDSLLREGRQLVLAADRPPASLCSLGSELMGRVSGGLVCSVEPADFTTRLGIAQQLATRLEVAVPTPVLELLASELSGDARQIAGALNRLHAVSIATRQPITRELASASLDDLFRATRRVVHMADIERAVCDVFGLDPKSLRDGRKAKSVTQPRMLAMWLARKYTRAAFSEISHYFGRRSHSTVISAEKKVSRWMAHGATIRLGPGSCRVEEALHRVERQLRTG